MADARHKWLKIRLFPLEFINFNRNGIRLPGEAFSIFIRLVLKTVLLHILHIIFFSQWRTCKLAFLAKRSLLTKLNILIDELIDWYPLEFAKQAVIPLTAEQEKIVRET